VKLEGYKTVLDRQQTVRGRRDSGDCRLLLTNGTREAALAELSNVFAMIQEEYREKGLALPSDTTR